MFKRWLMISCLVIGSAFGCEGGFSIPCDVDPRSPVSTGISILSECELNHTIFPDECRDNPFAHALKGVQNDTQVMALLATCERPNAADIGGRTLLELAAGRGQKEAVEKLFEKGADPAKQAPLKYAKDLAMAQLLHKHRAAGIDGLLEQCIGAGRYRIHGFRTEEEIKEDRLLALWALRNGANVSAWTRDCPFASRPFICETIGWHDLFSVVMLLRGHVDLKAAGDVLSEVPIAYALHCARIANTENRVIREAIHDAIWAASRGNFPDSNCSIEDYVKMGMSEESAKKIYETMQEIVALEKELPGE